MVNVSVEISEPHWQILKEIAKQLGLEPENLVQQEVNESMATMEIWTERATLGK
jgi:hypothetical protein